MPRTVDPTAERDINTWPLLAATILGIQGLGWLLYAAFLPPLTSAGIEVRVVGTMPFVWIAAATLALVAGAGVAARRVWARYLGTVSAVTAIAAALYNAQDVTTSLVGFILPGIVLFAIWRKWPASQSA